MIAVIQRVSRAAVDIEGRTVGKIGPGLLIFLGVAKGDGDADAAYIMDKLSSLRIFPDEAGKMNRSVADAGGSLLIVSQFTLLGDTRQGRRPGFDRAAPPELAKELYGRVVEGLRTRGLPVQTGQFGAYMQVALENDGPVTFILDSRE
jgi:D-tyrosyl-tRNA(Tyr) deacylase